MELTKRMKSSLIQSMLANIVLMLMFLWAILLFVLPKILEFWAQKHELTEMHTHINNIKKEGLSYWEFRQWVTAWETDDIYVRTLMQNIEPKFYTDNLANTSTNDYETFLTSREKEVLDIKSSEDFIKKEQTMDYVLPFYNKNNTFSEEGLTDFHFINYIENLIYTFNLEAEWGIWIGKVKKIWDDESSLVEADSLQEWIFSIPLKFEVTWQKVDIVDFIHFFENVGSIKIDEWKMVLYNDKFISKILEGDKPSPLYNIYRNHIADIRSITFTQYPDSSSQSSDKSLVGLMKSDQAREKVTAKIELEFYVAGVPGYKMEKYIYSLLDDFQILSEQVSLDAKTYSAQAYKFSQWNQIQAIGSLQSIDSLLLKFKEDMVNLRKRLSQRESIQELYDVAVEYRIKFTQIQELYDTKIALLKIQN